LPVRFIGTFLLGIRNIWNYLSKWSWFYLGLYVLTTLIFTGIFYSIRGDFYHPTFRYEPFLHGEADIILNELRDVLIKEFRKKHDDFVATYENFEVNSDDFIVNSWKVEDATASFRFLWDSKEHDGASTLHWMVTGSFDVMTIFSELRGKSFIHWYSVLFDNEGSIIRNPDIRPDVPVSDLFKTRKQNGKTHMLLPLSTSVRNRIDAFALGIKGRPKYLPHGFIRMFYLSSITITTLGYGDIVPLTSRARLLIALESLLGIMAIGLFLNHVGKRLAKPR